MKRNRNTKSQKIYQYIREKIDNNEFTSGERLPTENDLMKHFEVSRITVSSALRELQKEGIINRISGSGSYVNKASQPKEQIFALLIPELGVTDIFKKICTSILEEASRNNIKCIWRNINKISFERQLVELADLAQNYADEKVTGVFFIPFCGVPNRMIENDKIIQPLVNANIPVVLLDRDMGDFPLRSRFDLVRTNHHQGGYLLGEHLVKQGCKKIVFAHRKHLAYGVDERVIGAQEAIIKHSGTATKQQIIKGEISDVNFIDGIIKDLQPDAIVCDNDFSAATVMKKLSELSVKVPEKVRITGFDNGKYATLLNPALTTVKQPCEAIGRVAVKSMMMRIDNPDLPPMEVLLDCELIERESSQAKA